ncbi:extracellular matrix regulator RemB [Oceanobacillus iheyensis]|uniref:Hypothetical conserved protein n=1 Tax=Oceanobacillus iheyensis (strain DSM 14371 / CIP 107618 / JCM 11309 / KCTC 3954 / HTE831) TaxID=221109 RepID=Q8EU84_OCEIH|nr:DUF370 domain-containing protein [Oceanobacillus iheyensis]BAC11961.1 hypothetical conserved protein [Oceanobacillus iheyensis HTE831]
MFIHIGNGNVIRTKEIVAIIDCNLLSSSSIVDEMMEAWKKNKKVSGPRKHAKSIMLTEDHVYFSSLSVATLKKRSSMMSTINKLDDYSDELSI